MWYFTSIRNLAVLLMLVSSAWPGRLSAQSSCAELYSLYYEHYKLGNYEDALPHWQQLVASCPEKYQTAYVNGAKMYRKFAAQEMDEERKGQLVDSLLWVYDQRLKYFENDALVLGHKGKALLQFRPEQATKAYQHLQQSFDMAQGKVEASVVAALFKSQLLRYKQRRVERDELHQTVKHCFSTIDHALANHNLSNAKKENYHKADHFIAKHLPKVFTCEEMELIFKERFQRRPNDNKLLNQYLIAADSRNCELTPFYISTLQRTLVDYAPTYEAVKSIADYYLKKGELGRSIDSYREALKLASNDAQRLAIELQLAKANLLGKNYPAVRNHALKALQLDPNCGEAYLLIGDAYAASKSVVNDGAGPCSVRAIYWLSVDMFELAKVIDPSINERANKRIIALKAQYPTKESCFMEGLNPGDKYHLGGWINKTTYVRVQQ